MIPGIVAQRALSVAAQTNIVLALALNTSPYVAFYYADPLNPTGTFTKQIQPAALPAGAARDVSIHPNGLAAAVAAAGTTGINIYNTNTWARTQPSTNVSNAYTITYSRSGAYYASGGTGASPYVRLYNSSNNSIRATLSPTPSSRSQSDGIAFNDTGTILAVGIPGTSPYLRLHDTTTGVAPVVSLPASLSPGSYSIAYSPDGSKVAIAPQNSSQFHVYDTATWSTITTQSYAYTNTMNWVGDVLAINANGALKLLNTTTWTELPVPTISGLINNARLSANGSMLVVCMNSAPYVRVFDYPSLTERTLDVGITSVCNSADIYIPA